MTKNWKLWVPLMEKVLYHGSSGVGGGTQGNKQGGKMGRSSQFSKQGLHWSEVSCGGMEGNEGGLRQAGWPGPLLADGGKRHLGLTLRMLSSAAIVWRVQEQTHALHVSLATRNRSRMPPPKHCACTHTHTRTSPQCFSEPVCISGLHKGNILWVRIPIQQEPWPDRARHSPTPLTSEV